MENRQGLCVLFDVTPAVGAPESAVAVDQVSGLHNRGFAPRKVGGDKGYHSQEFVRGLREQGVVPHPARKDGQKTLHVLLTRAHAANQKVRKRIEETFGWAKTIGWFRKSRYLGVKRTHAQGQYVVAAYNLVRMAKLMLVHPTNQRGLDGRRAAVCPHPAPRPENDAGRAENGASGSRKRSLLRRKTALQVATVSKRGVFQQPAKLQFQPAPHAAQITKEPRKSLVGMLDR
jgi:hypothetical protein